MAMNDTSAEDIHNYLNDVEISDQKQDSDCDKSNKKIISIPLSSFRLNFLEHLLDDIYCFLNQGKRLRDIEILC